jgi:membrane-bound metal-dependent hydrolase YbcI (DUF457 family)
VNVITHLLMGWSVFEGTSLSPRDRRLLAFSSVVPDLDGLGAVVDVANRALSRPETFLFGEFHHRLCHGLPAACAFALLAAFAARARARVALGTFAMVHLHMACDLVGSRGPSPADIWPIWYLAPLSSSPELAWSGQWALNAWPNIVLTLALLAHAFVRTVQAGSSPVGLFHQGAHAVFVETVRRRWRLVRGSA